MTQKVRQAFQDYFDNFDFNSIPATERDKDVEDYAEIAKASKMASTAPLDDDSDILGISAFEMVSIGIVNGYKIEVWTSDGGDIPFFHVSKKDTNGKELNVPIRFLENRYYHHGGFRDTLDRDSLCQLVEFLKDDNCQKWKALIDLWNNNCTNVTILDSIRNQVPDFSHIQEG